MVRARMISPIAIGLLYFGLSSPQAYAVNKDMVQLQTQVQQLQDAVARLQQSNDERMGVLKDLVQQTADSVNKMSIVVNGMQLRMQNVQDASTAKSDQISGQVQSLNDSIDELKARLTRMEKALGDIQNNQQSTNAMLGNLPAVTGGTPQPGSPIPAGPSTTQAPPPAANTTAANTPPPPTGKLPPPAAGPSSGDMYRTAYGDFMAGKTNLATSEFNDLIKAYPDDNLSGNAYFYLGEIDLRANRPGVAIKSYDHVLEHYPDNSKIPAAHLHKGEALVAIKQTDAGIREYRALIQRFPNSPEAVTAKNKLTALGATTAARQD